MVIGYIPTGKWIYQPNRTFVAPICCGWDESAYKKHPECGKLPMPKQEYWGGYTFVGLKNSLAHMGGHGCSCNLFKDEYVLDNLPMWNPVQTCEKLGSRRVLMIGDSTMVQMAATLMNAVRPGGCQTQFTFMVGDTLTNKRMGSLNRGTLWTTSVILKKPDIVILSAGPHVYKRKNFALVMDSVIQGTKNLTQMFPSITVAWRTQPPGGCTSKIRTELELGKKYQYSEFYERDLYALYTLPRHGIHTIDMRMLYYRTDAHVGNITHLKVEGDCMHLCYPGPGEIIAPLFSELLDKL
mmetsp:Transcript_40558/g.46285  ORF Transcript_40558/g.46285 Transcript_40558/m.46285 type:complete len:296 (+) Transcript_40558:65-952(+)